MTERSTRRPLRGASAALALAVALAPTACDRPSDPERADHAPLTAEAERDAGGRGGAGEGAVGGPSASAGSASADLRTTLDRSLTLADSVEERLRPVPLMRPAEEQALRRYLNDAHVARARSLGVRPADAAEVRALTESGGLVRLEDSTSQWIVRDGASAWVTPDTRALLQRIAERFQAALAERGLPAYRLEVTSALRTAADQAALRRRNPNAAAGTSSHEFGTTLDIAYEAFAPPSPLPPGLVPDGAPESVLPDLERVASLALESVSGRKSRELKTYLADVLTELQSAGDVLVILERQQPVFHITLGRALGAR